MEWLIPILVQLPWGEIGEVVAAFLAGLILKQPKMVERAKEKAVGLIRTR